MKPSNHIVIVGGGIVGVFAALYARKLASTAQITLVDHDVRLGGLLRSDAHPNGLLFDRGTHILSWTGNGEIDNLLFDDLPANRWHFFDGAHRDLSGLFVDGKVQEGSPFLPLRCSSLSANELLRLRPERAGESRNLMHALARRFGAAVADDVFRTPIRNLYGEELENLDTFVAAQLPLSRVVVDNLDTWLTQSWREDYRALVACPEQRLLPERFAKKLRAAYPRMMGIEQLFDELGRKLDVANIEVRLETGLTALLREEGRVTELRLLTRAGEATSIRTEDMTVIWAVSPFPLVKLLGGMPRLPPLQQPWKTIIVDFTARMRRELQCYYYIDYGFNPFFRLTNYAAMCEQARGLAHAPFTYEVWYRDGELTVDVAHDLVARQFLDLGLISAAHDIKAVRVRNVAQGAVAATLANMEAIRSVAEAVADALPRNMLNIGLLSSRDLFFTADLLHNAQRCLAKYFGVGED